MLAEGQRATLDELSGIAREQQQRIGEAIQRVRREHAHAHPRGARDARRPAPDPRPRTEFRDRHALIVVRGTDYRRDLRAIRPYIRDLRPVLVGVDGGGDALLEAGLKPDLIIGDMDSASDRVLTCGAELVVHAYRDGTRAGPRAARAARPRAQGAARAGHEPGRRDAGRVRARRAS